LLNATCIAANAPNLLALLPTVQLNVELSLNLTGPLAPGNLSLIAHHYFASATTAVFNFDIFPEQITGLVISSKKDQANSPAGSIKGPANISYGAVPWLFLEADIGTVGSFKSIYRLNTAGGEARATGDDLPAAFTVPYSAIYHFLA
ncbi:hypothetical protein BGW36DRAFT_305589, partial [Talaromyces proteolyticus]